MCPVLLPPGVNPIAIDKYIIYIIVSATAKVRKRNFNSVPRRTRSEVGKSGVCRNGVKLWRCSVIRIEPDIVYPRYKRTVQKM